MGRFAPIGVVVSLALVGACGSDTTKEPLQGSTTGTGVGGEGAGPELPECTPGIHGVVDGEPIDIDVAPSGHYVLAEADPWFRHAAFNAFMHDGFYFLQGLGPSSDVPLDIPEGTTLPLRYLVLQPPHDAGDEAPVFFAGDASFLAFDRIALKDVSVIGACPQPAEQGDAGQLALMDSAITGSLEGNPIGMEVRQAISTANSYGTAVNVIGEDLGVFILTNNASGPQPAANAIVFTDPDSVHQGAVYCAGPTSTFDVDSWTLSLQGLSLLGLPGDGDGELDICD